VCVFTRSAYTTYTFDELIVSGGPTLNIYTLLKFYYNADERYIEKLDLYYSPGMIELLFEELDNPKTYDFVCGIMSSKCGFDTTGCQDKLEGLPTFSDGVHFDGNSMGCRALHAVMANWNPSQHCAHIAFEPTEDPSGKIKCQESKGKDPMDLFDEDDISHYEQFCDDHGVDPIVGYALLDDMEHVVSSDKEGEDYASQTSDNDASTKSGVAPRVTKAAVSAFVAALLYLLL